jgi:hypothetical protein
MKDTTYFKSLTIALLLTIASLSQVFSQIEVTNYGAIPLDRLAISRWQHFEWDASGTWETIDVTKNGILPNTTIDIAPLVEKIINEGTGKRILQFPAGTFNIKTQVDISKDDIQIVGVGKTTRFMLAGGASDGGFSSGGSRSGNYTLTKDALRGDNTVTFSSTSGLDVGDYFIMVQSGTVTRPDAEGDETQIFKITAKSGNTLTLDMKFGIPFYKNSSTAQETNFRKNLRFHNFYMEKTSLPASSKHDNISLNTIRNVEVSNIESNKAFSSHVQIFRGREVIFHDNNFYGNYGGGGGFQYGIKINLSTNCHVINNVASNLRHHYATQYGSNHCVIAYNRALPTYNDYADFGQHNSKGCHNNLFEGNYGEEIYDDANPRASWGTRYTMWFRNHALVKIGSENPYVENMNIIGNELKAPASGIKMGDPGKFTFAGGNIVSISKEGGTGTLIWGDMKSGAAIPASLFLKNRPSYVARWPLYGPAATFPTTNTDPTGSFTLPTFTSIEEGYTKLEFLVEAFDVDASDVLSLTMFVDGKSIRTDNTKPYQWGHTSTDVNTAKELLNLLPGNHEFKVVISDGKGGSKTIIKMINVAIKPDVVNVLEYTENLGVNVYPNPSETGVFHFSREISFEVLDMLGNLVQKGTGDQVDLSNFAKGNYVIKEEGLNEKVLNKL